MKAPAIRTESDLWSHLKADRLMGECFLERFEDRSKAGVPDCYIGSNDKRIWVELKTDTLTYRRGQLSWAIAASQRGERVATLMWKQGKAIVYDQAAVGRAVALGGDFPEALWSDITPARSVAWALQAFPFPERIRTARAGLIVAVPVLSKAPTPDGDTPPHDRP